MHYVLRPSSFVDPDLNPDPDPHVFGPPGSGSLVWILIRILGMDPDPDPSIIKQK